MRAKKLLTTFCLVALTGCQFGNVPTSTPIQPSSSTTQNSTTSSSTTSSDKTSSTTSKEEVLDLESCLDEFKKGIKLSIDVEENYSNQTNMYYLRNTSKEKESEGA